MNILRQGKSFVFSLVLILTITMCLFGTGFAQEVETPEAVETVSSEPVAGETTDDAGLLESEPTPAIEAAAQKQLDLESGAAAAAVAPAVLSESESALGSVTLSAEDILSLESAHPYQANTIQTAKITLAGAVKLRIRFESDFCLENGYDTFGIYLFEADLNGYRLLDGRTYTGTDLAGQTVEVPGETAVLRMETDGSVEENGWRVAEIQADYPEPTAETTESVVEEVNDELPAVETQEVVTEEPAGEPTAVIPETEVPEIAAETAPAATEEAAAIIYETTETDIDEKSFGSTAVPRAYFNLTVVPGAYPVTFFWDHVPCYRYQVRRKKEGESLRKVIATTTEEMFTTFVPEDGNIWIYDIRAIDEDDNPIGYSFDVWFRWDPLAHPVVHPPVDKPEGLLITWNEVEGADSYEVCRSTSSNPNFDTFYDCTSVIGLSFLHSGISADTTYYYLVYAKRNDMRGPAYYVVGGRHNIQRSVLSAVRLNNTQVRLNWTAVPGATGYKIWRSETSPASGYGWTALVDNVTGTVMTLPSPTKTYYYKVAAVVADMIGPLSSPVTVPPVTLGAPTINPITRVSANSLRVSWNAVPGATGYRLFRSETSPTSGYGWVANVGNVTAVVTNVPSTKTYYYRVAALSGSTVGPLSSPVAGTTAIASQPTINPIQRISANSLRVSWNAVPGATGYRLWRSETSPTSGYSWVANVGNVTAVVTSVPSTKTYFYRVAAMSGSTVGPLSAPVAGTTAMKPPVMNPIVKVLGGKFRLTWSAVPGVTGYRLFRSETSPTSGYGWVVNVGNVTGTVTSVPNLNKRYYYKVLPIYWGGQLGLGSNVVTAIYNQ